MRFPHYYQLESKECGITCLKIISSYYGKKYSNAQLKSVCSVTRLGVSLQDIIDGACELGFETLPVKVAFENIQEMLLPSIIFWRQEHYVVLYKVEKRRDKLMFHISDPAFGRITVNEEIFRKQWLGNEASGVALLMEPTEKFYEKIPEKNVDPKTYLKIAALFGLIIKQNKVKAALAFLLILIGMIATWLFPSIFRRMIDEGVMGKNLNIVIALLLTQLIIFVSQLTADSLSAIMLMQINFKMSILFLVKYLHKLIRLPLKAFDTRINSDFIMRMDDSDRIQSFLTYHSLEFILSLVNLTIFSAILLNYNTKVFFVFFIMSFLSIGWTVLFLNKRKILDYSRFTVSSETRNNIYELINEMPEIKINGAHHNKIGQWELLQQKLNKISLEGLYLNYYQLIGSNFFNKIKDILITALCAYLVINEKMTLGLMMTIGFILGQLNSPINSLISIIRGLQDTKLSFDRLEEIQRLDDEDNGKHITLQFPPKSAIHFQEVSFKYEGSYSPFVLKNITFNIPVGKITAVVGASGSGKTTLLKLLLSVYAPTSGKICLDSLDLSLVKAESWRNECGAVLQNGFIYSGTYAQNIAIADNQPDMDRIREVAKLACIDRFIDSLPLGYNTHIGRTGIDQSGGQKQRILIARALYRNPKFILLDEATSSLDANNEKEIMENSKAFFAGKTVVIIAHRLSTVKNADQILVLDKGEIVELGGHDELVRRQGKYFELVKNQLELGN